MRTIIYVFLVLAIVGAAVTLGIHVACLFGIIGPFDLSIKFLGPGVFLVFLPMIFVGNRLTRDFKQKDFWRAALRGCPVWMRRTLYILVGYAWAGFFMLTPLYGGGMNSPGNKAREISAGLLIFYLLPAAVFYSTTRIPRADANLRCLNGHTIPPLAKFCPECGAPLDPHSEHASEPAPIN